MRAGEDILEKQAEEELEVVFNTMDDRKHKRWEKGKEEGNNKGE
jgi:hypothetical protein